MAHLPPSKFFPPAESADVHGILGVGGRLSPEWLIDAYSHGIFPWPWDPDPREPVPWFSPDPRAILPLDDRFHVSRRLERTCRSSRFTVTFDHAFGRVMRECAQQPGRGADQTWITTAMLTAYTRMHELGLAHSVEVWEGEKLVGGAYGVALAGFFAAESKFHSRRDASKVALVALVRRLRDCGYELLDVQMTTPHLEQFGAIEISRDEYLERLAEALRANVRPITEDETL